MAVTLHLVPEIERRLREEAARNGLTLEIYLQQMVETYTRLADGSIETDIAQQLSPAEFAQQLDALSDGLPPIPTLPDNWSRADLHADHD